jgi:murein L,D-transpeptidase YcbB/YkuD
MLLLLLILFAFSPAPPAPEAARPQDDVPAAISRCIAGLQRAHPAPDPHHTCIRQLYDLYAPRQFRPLWTQRRFVDALLREIDSAGADGLDPDDYHREAVFRLMHSPPSTMEERVQAELLLSDSFLTLAAHLRYGKVDPLSLDPNWNFPGSGVRSAIGLRMPREPGEDGPAVLLQDFRPRHPKYHMLRRALGRYRAIEASGGWPVVPPGPALTLGMKSPRVQALRRRLAIVGDLESTATDTSTVFDRELSLGVRRFQKRHGLNDDGVPGTATQSAMNVPASVRVEAIRVNLERYRWFLNGLDSTYVLVNIAGFSLQYVEKGDFRWATRVIVGRPYRKTPVFKADMVSVVFNPRWVVPPTILVKDALPAIRKDPGWLKANSMSVIDSKGRTVDPASVDWHALTGASFPYRLQQAAGDEGALGRLKFLLPNPHIVYLHDTPKRELFKQSARTFSSGCIRVENPRRLAQLVLADSVRWSPERIDEFIDAGRTRTVSLPRPVPVLILYLTAMSEGDVVMFRNDVYRRDAAVLQALQAPLPQYKTESCGF